ncbi:MAG: YraN family protein [Armatimonadota bacterium]
MNWPWKRRLLTRQELGALGERHAARALRAAGLRILEANYRTRQGELDLIARDGDTLVIVEVRTRTVEDAVSPLASVDARKQTQLVRMARYYRRARHLDDCPCRFDIVEVIATPTGQVTAVRHIPEAFIEGL